MAFMSMWQSGKKMAVLLCGFMEGDNLKDWKCAGIIGKMLTVWNKKKKTVDNRHRKGKVLWKPAQEFVELIRYLILYTAVLAVGTGHTAEFSHKKIKAHGAYPWKSRKLFQKTDTTYSKNNKVLWNDISGLEMYRDRTDFAVRAHTHIRAPDTNSGSYNVIHGTFFQAATGIFPDKTGKNIAWEKLSVVGVAA